MDIKKFRAIRQLVSSIVCVGLGILFMRLHLAGKANDHFIFQVLLTIVAAGMIYLAFSIAQYILRLISREGFIRSSRTPNFILDTVLYLILAAGAIFLVMFLCNKFIWIGLLLTIGGAINVYLDIRTITKIDFSDQNQMTT